jgi:cytochrome P450
LLLAMNMEKQQRVLDEIDAVCGKDTNIVWSIEFEYNFFVLQPITYDMSTNLEYIEAVLKESLRLYPHASGWPLSE